MASHLHLAADLDDVADDVQAAEGSIRVVLADDHERMRRGLRLLLDDERGVEVIAEARDLASVARHVHGHGPQLLALDLNMPGGSSLETIGRLRERAPETQIVVMTMQDDPAFVQRALDAGALGFVVKDRAAEELPSAIRAAARGEEFVSPPLAARLEVLHRALTDEVLTACEVEVVRLLALGHTSVEIACKLNSRRARSRRIARTSTASSS